MLRALHYPPQTGPIDERVIGIGAHTEYGLILSFRLLFFFFSKSSASSFEVR